MLVTVAFALTLVPGFRRRGHSLLSVRDQGTALLVFLVLGVLEETAAVHVNWYNERVVAACASGLVAGPWVGLAVGVFMTFFAVMRDGLPMWSIGIAMLGGGLAGGWLCAYRPELARRAPAGFCLTVLVSWVRASLTYWHAHTPQESLFTFGQLGVTPVLQGLATALVLEVVAQVRGRDEQARVAAQAEVRALQARMNPHFLFNALNTLSALATIAPRDVPRAASRLRHFLRASFDQAERPLVPLQEELDVVRAYLDIERLRLGSRLRVEETVPPGLTDALIPPFSLQPLVENAVQHGLHSSLDAGRLWISVRSAKSFLELNVRDDGLGVPAGEVEQVFFGERSRTHALALLRRRLRGLFGGSFWLEASSDPGQGTTVTMRIPLQTPARTAVEETPEAVAADPGVLLSH